MTQMFQNQSCSGVQCLAISTSTTKPIQTTTGVVIPSVFPTPFFQPTELIYQLAIDFNQLYAPWHTTISAGVCMFGITSNLLNIFVLQRQQLRTPTNAVLTLVAFCDLLLMTDYVVMRIHRRFFAPTACSQSYIDAILLLCHANIGVTLYGISTWLTVALGGMRCLILRTKGLYDSYRTAFTLIGLVVIGVFCTCVPNYISHGIIWVPADIFSCNMSIQLPVVGASNFSASHGNLPLRLAFWVSGILFKILPCILLTVFMIMLIRILVKSQQIRRKLHRYSTKKSQTPRSWTKRRSRTNANCQLQHGASKMGNAPSQPTHGDCNLAYRVTLVLVGILFIFFLTQAPQGLCLILTAILSDDFRHYFYNNIGDISELMSLINCSVNFVLYCAMSSQYRSACSELFTSAYYAVTRVVFNKCPLRHYSTSIVDCDSCIEKHVKVVHVPSSERSFSTNEQPLIGTANDPQLVPNYNSQRTVPPFIEKRSLTACHHSLGLLNKSKKHSIVSNRLSLPLRNYRPIAAFHQHSFDASNSVFNLPTSDYLDTNYSDL